jgi:hypothetical protein
MIDDDLYDKGDSGGHVLRETTRPVWLATLVPITH